MSKDTSDISYGDHIYLGSRKAILNERKHNVSFTEAQTVFADPFAIIIPDE